METSTLKEDEIFQIAIDGPAASGKGTVARMLAKKFGCMCLDTGSLYRGITIHFLNHNVDLADEDSITEAINNIDLRVDCVNGCTLIFLDGENITEKLHDLEVSEHGWKVARISRIREKVRNIQYETAKKGTLVCEGRDITSVVFPNAKVKFYLTASLKSRAKRRFLQEVKIEPTITLEQVKQGIYERDEADMSRVESPLIRVKDAIIIDCSRIKADKVVKKMEKAIKKKLHKKV
ncbi:MAG: (d)CMP kinase [Firmicutes bacterium]|nr:(d)CMP kinase [Bacillota bacterium]